MPLDIRSPLAMALAYARHGWPCFPLHTVKDGVCDCRSACGRSAGKHPRTIDGFKGASVAAAAVERWWSMWPLANVGVRTGAESGLVVVDIDPRNGGLETVAALAAAGTVFQRTAQVVTQSGGFHLYYRHPGRRVKASLGAGVDVKSGGGYVVAPPSVGAGGAYVWQVAMEPASL